MCAGGLPVAAAMCRAGLWHFQDIILKDEEMTRSLAASAFLALF
jgi:hypothetical protein